MKRFLINVGVFIIVFLVVNHLLYYLPFIKRKDYGKIVPKVDETHWFVFGDSHANRLVPSEGFKFYKYSYPSDNIIDMGRKIRYLARNEIISSQDTILFEIDYHLFTPYRTSLNNNDLSSFFVEDFFQRTSYYKNLYFPLFGDKRVISKNSIISLIKGKSSLTEETQKEATKVELQLNTYADSSRINRRFNQQYSGYTVEQKFIEELGQLIEFCSNKGITIVFIRYPLSPIFQEKLSTINLDSYDSLVSPLLRNGTVLDYVEIFDSNKFFIDGDHINPLGAENLSRIIIKDTRKQ